MTEQAPEETPPSEPYGTYETPPPPRTMVADTENALGSAAGWVANLGEQGLSKFRGGQPADPQKNGIAIAAMILGIVAITFGFWMTGFVEIPVGITGLVLACVALGRANRGAPYKGFAVTGLVLTLVAAPLYLMALILTLGLWFLV
jgi:hypothetical protein